MTRNMRLWWLIAASAKFCFGLWLKRHPKVMDNLLRIVFGLADRKRGAMC